jgi:hypothetical protein
MQNELSVRMKRRSSVFFVLRAVVMAASSALLIMCLYFWDLISIGVTCVVRGLTTPAPIVLLPLTCEPSVYTKSLGFHFLLWGLVLISWVCGVIVLGWVCRYRTCCCLW